MIDPLNKIILKIEINLGLDLGVDLILMDFI